MGVRAPAIAPAERRAVRPLLILAPALFAAGAAFRYFVVLPPAVGFLQGFAHGAFDVSVQARADGAGSRSRADAAARSAFADVSRFEDQSSLD